MNLPKALQVKQALFRSRVARRIFALFILCALIPLSVLAYISLSQVTRNLYSEANEKLREASKASGMTIVERMWLLETDFRKIQCVTFDHTSVSAGTPHLWQKLHRFEYRK